MNILSIQSSVAYGYVGNSAAGFTLRRLGHEAWTVNTVQFSNHTGYDGWGGNVFSADDVAAVLQGIEARGLFPACDAVLTGYLGDPTLAAVVLDTVKRLRAANPDLVYCCDPVMGDFGRGFYVRAGIPRFLRAALVPAADITMPNLFELESLVGRPVRTLDDALTATALVRSWGPSVVVVTSLSHRSTESDAIDMLVATAAGAWRVSTPYLAFETAPNGAGDVCAAQFLAHFLETGDPHQALERTASAVFALLRATCTAGSRELSLVAAQDAWADPERHFSADRIA